MSRTHDFFISHNSKDDTLATELKEVLLEIDPSFDVFLDHDQSRPLEQSREWQQDMLDHAVNSRYLIFVASSPNYLKQEMGWMFSEIRLFNEHNVTRGTRNQMDRTVEYFGIIYKPINLQEDLYSDPRNGRTYEHMYSYKQHILLEPGESIKSAHSRIEDKVRNMITWETDLSAELMDKVRAYTERRQMQDDMFFPDAIEDLLIPALNTMSDPYAKHPVQKNRGSQARSKSAVDNVQVISFEELCSRLSDTHVAVLGEQGGCGKTTLMTRLFFHFLNAADPCDPNAMIPLFVDARSLTGSDNLILRHLAETLYCEYTIKTSQFTTASVSRLSNEFSLKRDRPRYLLLIDGLNELPPESAKKLDKELLRFSPDECYPNVRLVLSGRTLPESSMSETNYLQVTIDQLTIQQVYEYLNNNQHRSDHIKLFLREVKLNGILENRGTYTKRKIESMMATLRTPLFTKIFVDSSDSSIINTKGELMRQFILYQDERFQNSDADEFDKAFNHLCLNHILPCVCHAMITNAAGSQYAVSERELMRIMARAIKLMDSMEYRIYYGHEYRERLVALLEYGDALKISDRFVNHMLKHSKLLRKTVDKKFELVHQVYRDYFAAYYITEDIKRSLEEYEICESLQAELFTPDLRSFIVELLQEVHIPFDWETKYEAYRNSPLIQLLDIARDNDRKDTSRYVANVIALLRTVRLNDMSGIDFSNLDLTRSNLRTCMLAHQSDTEIFAANFRGATINAENILEMKHKAPVIAACVGVRSIATCDRSGTIILWDRKKSTDVPDKIIDGVGHELIKMIFAPDEMSLYAMSDHRILQIHIPKPYRTIARYTVLLESPRQLLDIRLAQGGRPEFSTVLNPTNFKPVSQPDQPDRWTFRQINSCAAVSADNTYLAISLNAHKNGLKLYRRDNSTDCWTEKPFGYAALLDGYFHELEDALRSFGVYDVLDSVAQQELPTAYKYLPFMTFLRNKFEYENRCSDRSLTYILNDIISELEKNGVVLQECQRLELDRILQNTLARVLEERTKHNVLLDLSRRDIRSVSWHPTSNMLLVAYTKFHDVPQSSVSCTPAANTWYQNTVLELDPDTMRLNLITEFTTEYPVSLTAYYSGNCIVVIRQGSAAIYDCNGELDRIFGYRKCSINSFVFLGEDDDVCAVSFDNIYRLDSSNRCVAAWHNDLDSTELLYCESPDGERCLVSKSRFQRETLFANNYVLKLQNGMFNKVSKRNLIEFNSINFSNPDPNLPKSAIRQGRRAYRHNSGKIQCYLDDVKVSEIDTYYKLFICGCDFRDIKGTLGEPEHLQVLYQYGALTDPFPQSEEFSIPEYPTYVPSQVPFRYKERNIPSPDTSHISTKEPSFLFWNSIQNKLSESAYRILEWFHALEVTTPATIYQLMTAQTGCKFWNVIDNRKTLEYDMHYLIKFRLIWCPIEYSREPSMHRKLFTLSKLGGQALLRRGSEPVPLDKGRAPVKAPDSSEYLKKYSLNRWFGTVVQKYGPWMTDHSLYKVYDSTLRMSARGRINGFVQLKDQAFLVEPVLYPQSDEDIAELRNKVRRMCAIAECYTDLTRFDKGIPCRLLLTRPPVLIFVTQKRYFCQSIHQAICDICPNVRKLYTYHELTAEDYTGTMHFEFVDDQPYAVDLKDLIQADLSN